jgi:pimeloyl-ACP methyl ester carboxylesterase
LSQRAFIFVPGILHDPGWATGWIDRACTWVSANLKGDTAHEFEYYARPLTRRFTLDKRGRELANLIAELAGGSVIRKLILVGHSNGGEVICRALAKLAPHLNHARRRQGGESFLVDRVHLLSPACSADFENNGLNTALLVNNVGDVSVYVAGRDGKFLHPMWWARMSRAVGFLGLGYGLLGLKGPQDVAPAVMARVHTFTEPQFEHGTWFADHVFGNTMRLVTAPRVEPRRRGDAEIQVPQTTGGSL